MRVFFSILFSLCFLSFFSQKGNLEISYNDWESGDVVIELYKGKGDTIVDSCFYSFCECAFNDLNVGEYNIKIIKDDTLIKRLYKVEVEDGKITSYYSYGESISTNEIADTIVHELFTTTINYLSSLNNPGFNKLINREFRFGFLQGSSFLINKNIELGIKGGVEFSLTDFKNDTSLLGLTGVRRERYFDWNLSIEPSIRFSTNNRRSYESKGLFVELGTCYHFPLVFRHVYSLNQSRYTQSRIHNFNNLEGVLRLGYEEFSIMASYRFFNVVKDNFPQLPKLNVGLSLVIAQ